MQCNTIHTIHTYIHTYTCIYICVCNWLFVLVCECPFTGVCVCACFLRVHSYVFLSFYSFLHIDKTLIIPRKSQSLKPDVTPTRPSKNTYNRIMTLCRQRCSLGIHNCWKKSKPGNPEIISSSLITRGCRELLLNKRSVLASLPFLSLSSYPAI